MSTNWARYGTCTWVETLKPVSPEKRIKLIGQVGGPFDYLVADVAQQGIKTGREMSVPGISRTENALDLWPQLMEGTREVAFPKTSHDVFEKRKVRQE